MRWLRSAFFLLALLAAAALMSADVLADDGAAAPAGDGDAMRMIFVVDDTSTALVHWITHILASHEEELSEAAIVTWDEVSSLELDGALVVGLPPAAPSGWRKLEELVGEDSAVVLVGDASREWEARGAHVHRIVTGALDEVEAAVTALKDEAAMRSLVLVGEESAPHGGALYRALRIANDHEITVHGLHRLSQAMPSEVLEALPSLVRSRTLARPRNPWRVAPHWEWWKDDGEAPGRMAAQPSGAGTDGEQEEAGGVLLVADASADRAFARMIAHASSAHRVDTVAVTVSPEQWRERAYPRPVPGTFAVSSCVLVDAADALIMEWEEVVGRVPDAEEMQWADAVRLAVDWAMVGENPGAVHGACGPLEVGADGAPRRRVHVFEAGADYRWAPLSTIDVQ